MSETKSEIRARIDELKDLRASLVAKSNVDISELQLSIVEASEVLAEEVDKRIQALREKLEVAEEDLFRSIVRSHEVLCDVKNMDQKAAFGQDPAMYYTMGICGEAGEMANKIVKALRNGDSPEKAREAVISELPDVIVYSAILAFVLAIDLTKLTNEKAQVVIERAQAGYYGHAFKDKLPSAAPPTGGPVDVAPE
jgi:NTP pyrophosphatase (non-canonical NTP hydrolase)